MPKLISECIDDVTVYLVVNDFGTPGCAFVETGISEADRETVIRNFLTGQYSNALRVVAFNTAEGWSRDVSEDIAGESRRQSGGDPLGGISGGGSPAGYGVGSVTGCGGS